LELANNFSVTRVECFSDSELMIRQLNGTYRVKNEKLHELFLLVKEKARGFKGVTYSHLPREEGLIKKADKLANLAIDEKTPREETLSKLKESCFELQKVMEKLKKGKNSY
jgi:ribonuclease HI